MDYTDWPQAQALLTRLRNNSRTIATACMGSLATHTDDDVVIPALTPVADEIVADLVTLQGLLPVVTP